MKRVVLFAATAAVLVQFTAADITALQTLGYEVHMVCNQKEGNLSEEGLCRFREKFPGLVWHELDIRDNWASMRKNHHAFLALKALLEELHPALIHCHGTIAGYYGRKAAGALQIPAYYTAHDFRLFNGCLATERIFFFPWERSQKKHTDHFFAVCKEDAAYAKKVLKLRGVTYLPDRIACDTYATPTYTGAQVRKELGIPESATVLISVGALRMQKRYRIVLQAMARLEQPELHYIICGEGSDRLFLEKLIRQLHLEKQVHLLGYRLDIPDLLGASDIFCSVGRREGCNVAALEAIAAGLPLIAVRSHGTKEYLVQEESALCLKGNLVESCAKAIVRLQENKLLRRQIGAHNRAMAKAFQESGRMMELRKIYLSLEEK